MPEGDRERSIRVAMRYRPWSCGICSFRFFAVADARLHFDAELGSHPGLAPDITEHKEREAEREVRKRLLELPGQLATTSGQGSAASSPLDECDKQTAESGATLASPSQVSQHPDAPMNLAVSRNIGGIGSRTEDSIKAQCKGCGWLRTSTSESVKKHLVRRHTKSPPFKCPECQFAGWRQQAMRDHKRKEHPDSTGPTFEKMIDEEEIRQLRLRFFGTDANVGRRRPSEQRKWLCRGCGWSGAEKGKHIVRKHLSSRPFRCRHCQRRFPDRWKIHKHLRAAKHALVEPTDFVIDDVSEEKKRLCRQLFGSSEVEAEEVGVSVGDAGAKPQESLDSGAAVEDASPAHQLTAAVVNHTFLLKQPRPAENEKTGSCRDCGWSGKQTAANRRNHIVRKHLSSKPFRCRHCQSTFRDRERVNMHLRASGHALAGSSDFVKDDVSEKVNHLFWRFFASSEKEIAAGEMRASFARAADEVQPETLASDATVRDAKATSADQLPALPAAPGAEEEAELAAALRHGTEEPLSRTSSPELDLTLVPSDEEEAQL